MKVTHKGSISLRDADKSPINIEQIQYGTEKFKPGIYPFAGIAGRREIAAYGEQEPYMGFHVDDLRQDNNDIPAEIMLQKQTDFHEAGKWASDRMSEWD